MKLFKNCQETTMYSDQFFIIKNETKKQTLSSSIPVQTIITFKKQVKKCKSSSPGKVWGPPWGSRCRFAACCRGRVDTACSKRWEAEKIAKWKLARFINSISYNLLTCNQLDTNLAILNQWKVSFTNKFDFARNHVRGPRGLHKGLIMLGSN